MGSVSNQIIQHAHNVPLWLNAGQVTDARVLVAVDGSEASLRAVDHVAYMLGGNPEAVVNFLHVVPTLASYCAIDLADHKNAWDNFNGEITEEEFRREDSVCINDSTEKPSTFWPRPAFPRSDQVRGTGDHPGRGPHHHQGRQGRRLRHGGPGSPRHGQVTLSGRHKRPCCPPGRRSGRMAGQLRPVKNRISPGPSMDKIPGDAFTPVTHS